MICFHGYVRRQNPEARLAALISASRDGGLLAHILNLYGITAVRGSSSRRGAQALLELCRLESGNARPHVAITPDGPRGPRYVVQQGIIDLAQLTGMPIIPTSNRSAWKKATRSWDGFQIPLPFSRCEVIFAEPLLVPRRLTLEERETYRAELEKRLKAITVD